MKNVKENIVLFFILLLSSVFIYAAFSKFINFTGWLSQYNSLDFVHNFHLEWGGYALPVIELAVPILFFISSQLNLKPIYQYYTEGELSNKSLLLDKSSLFFKNGLINQGHLLLLEIHQGHVDKMTDIEPNEVDDILSKLEKSINN